MYFETSAQLEASCPQNISHGTKKYDRAMYFSPQLTVADGCVCELKFYYSMYGKDSYGLNIQVTSDSNPSWRALWSRAFQQQNDSTSWSLATVYIGNKHLKVGDSFRIAFVGIRGTGDRGDIAIDDLVVTERCGQTTTTSTTTTSTSSPTSKEAPFTTRTSSRKSTLKPLITTLKTTTQSYNKGGQASSSSFIPVISGAAGGAIVLIAVIVLFALKRRQKSLAERGNVQVYDEKEFHTVSNTLYLSGHDAEEDDSKDYEYIEHGKPAEHNKPASKV